MSQTIVKRALLVACSQYGGDEKLTPLPKTKQDLEIISEALQTHCAFNADNIQTLVDVSDNEVRKQTEKFLSEFAANDFRVFFFAGHGLRDAHGDFFLALNETQHKYISTGISGAQIRNFSGKGCDKQLLIFDCCNSASVINIAGRDGPTASSGLEVFTDKIGSAAIENIGSGRWVLAASGRVQAALDELDHTSIDTGVFSQCIAQGLGDYRAADNTGFVTVDSLYRYVHTEVKKATGGRQEPARGALGESSGTCQLSQPKQPGQPLSDGLVRDLEGQDPKKKALAITQLRLDIEDNELWSEAALKHLQDISQKDDSISARKEAQDQLTRLGLFVEAKEKVSVNDSLDEQQEKIPAKVSWAKAFFAISAALGAAALAVNQMNNLESPVVLEPLPVVEAEENWLTGAMLVQAFLDSGDWQAASDMLKNIDHLPEEQFSAFQQKIDQAAATAQEVATQAEKARAEKVAAQQIAAEEKKAAEQAAQEKEAQRLAAQQKLAEEKKLQALLDQAQERFEARHISTPYDGSALDLYRQVLVLDAGNSVALQGVSQVADYYKDSANRALDAGRFDRASAQIERLRFVDSENAAITPLQNRLELSQQIATQITQADLPKQPFEPTMVNIPAGQFDMGCLSNDSDCVDDEKPVRKDVQVAAFRLGRTEVTVAQFRAFADAVSYKTDAEKNREFKGCRTRKDNKWEWREGAGWRSPGYAQEDNFPVVCVSHNDALAYAQWLTKTTGRAYRLPSEAEWEYAARAGSSDKYSFGDHADQLCLYGNGADKTESPDGTSWTTHLSCTDGHWFSAPVAKFKLNKFGLADMHGNVWEWVQDNWHNNYDGAPSSAHVWQGGDDTRRVLRGGSWYSIASRLRSADRAGYSPVYRNYSVGFRVAQDAP